MSLQSHVQTGTPDPMPPSAIELQQIALAMLLIWDALGEYPMREVIEEAILYNWAQKHKVRQRDAHRLLALAKERLCQNPWAHYAACRDFQAEGWITILLIRPEGNSDVMNQVADALKHRPFPERPHSEP